MKNKVVIILSLIILCSLGIDANEPNKAQLKADHLRYKREEKIYIATGNVYLDYKGNEITSNKLRMNYKDNLSYFKGDVYLKRNEGDEITSKEMELDLSSNILIAKKDVSLVSKKNGKNLKLTSNYLKLWTESSDMVAKGDVLVIYDGQEIRGERLDYDDKKEEMIVTDQVELKEEGQWLKSEQVVISLADGNLDAQGGVEMEFEIKE